MSGWRIVFVPDAPVMHVKGASTHGRVVPVEWHKHRGMWRFYRKFYGQKYTVPMMWIVGLGIWLHFAMVAGASVLRRETD
jgi:GT2 family glycosyltransferase